ncbi:MAG: polysaccharide biosynthesis protein [Verrucomicrobiales bacterium]|nr:polysaccharide biosynthesis protein [Verrucomicrobiales bacterium]
MLFRNLGANMIAGVAGPVISILFARFYIKKIGLDGFGAVGFFAIFSVVIQTFTQGINVTLERRAASKLQVPSERQSVQAFFGTLQYAYWVSAVLIFVSAVVSSGYLSEHLQGRKGLLASDAQLSICAGAALISLNILTGFYGSLFVGIGKQVFLSSVQTCSVLMQTAISVGLVILKPVPSSFIAGQVVATASAALILGYKANREVGWRESRLKPDLKYLKAETRESLALVSLEALGVIITYIDRMMVAAFLPFASLGAYTVAQTGARGLSVLRGPMLQAFTPIILSWSDEADSTLVRGKFWKIQGILMTMVGVLATVLILTSKQIIVLWLNDDTLADIVAAPMSLLVAGSFLLVMSGPSYLVAVSRKYTRPVLVYNIASTIVMASAGPWCAGKFGLTGAASMWVGYCAGSLIATHAGIARLLYPNASLDFIKDAGRIFVKSVAVVTIVCGFHFFIMHWFGSGKAGPEWAIIRIAILSLVGFAASYGILLGFSRISNLSRYVSS